MNTITSDTPLAERVNILCDALQNVEAKLDLALITLQALGHDVANLKGNSNATTQRDLGVYGSTAPSD